MKYLLALASVALIAIGIYQYNQTEVTTPTNTETESEAAYQFEGPLEDVTKGETVRGINTKNLAKGTSQASFENGQYNLLATFENLPDPQGTDFYEGWVVRKGLNFNVISTGKAEKVDGVYKNIFTSEEDFSDHLFYVLTLEPDDGDPAPADHIVEGTMK